jgi:prenyltransferase beta subunit
MDLVDVESVVKYVQSLQNDDGSFCGDLLSKLITVFAS